MLVAEGFFFNILWKEISKIAAQMSSLMKADTPFYSFSVGLEETSELPTAELSPPICPPPFTFDTGSLIIAC